MNDAHDARAAVEQLRDAAAADADDGDGDDQAMLQEAGESLSESVEELIRVLEQHDALMAASADLPPASGRLLAKRGDFVVSRISAITQLVYAAATIGNRALENPAMQRKIATAMEMIEKVSAQRRAAAKKKSDKAAPRHDQMREWDAEIQAAHPNWTNNKSARAREIKKRLFAANGQRMSISGILKVI